MRKELTMDQMNQVNGGIVMNTGDIGEYNYYLSVEIDRGMQKVKIFISALWNKLWD